VSFDSYHYVPILKVKRGEKQALEAMNPGLKELMTPLLELVERMDKTPKEHRSTALQKLAHSLNGYRRCFLDIRAIDGDGAASARALLSEAEEDGLFFTPVIGLKRPAAVIQELLAHRSKGVALRLARRDFEEGRVEHCLEEVEALNLEPSDIDLIVDLGTIADLVLAGARRFALLFLNSVPAQEEWRTFTLSASAFPKSMGGVPSKAYALVERIEWTLWKELRERQGRLPTYSDSAIQHPSGVEDFDFTTMTPSASIRYAVPGDWLLIKGQSTKKVPAIEQFPELALRLVEGENASHFRGEAHCRGCAWIGAAADGEPGFGSAGVWRRIGTTHHLTTVVEEMAGLREP
jgi:hypothetical protein